MSGLDEKRLEAASRRHDYWNGSGTTIGCLNARRNAKEIVTAYLAASAPPAPDGLVERLQRLADYIDQMQTPLTIREEGDRAIYRESAATLSAQEAEIERLRKELDEARRLSDWYHETHNATIDSIWAIIGRDTGQNLNKRLSDLVAPAETAEAEVARLRKVVERAKETRFYIDCEFDGHDGPLLTIAVVGEDDANVYLVATDQDARDPWVVANVIPLIDRHIGRHRIDVPLAEFGHALRKFLSGVEHPVIIADSPVDIGRFCRALSTGRDGGWSSADFARLSFEVHNVDVYPTTLAAAVQHNAWWDAMALREHFRAARQFDEEVKCALQTKEQSNG